MLVFGFVIIFLFFCKIGCLFLLNLLFWLFFKNIIGWFFLLFLFGRLLFLNISFDSLVCIFCSIVELVFVFVLFDVIFLELFRFWEIGWGWMFLVVKFVFWFFVMISWISCNIFVKNVCFFVSWIVSWDCCFERKFCCFWILVIFVFMLLIFFNVCWFNCDLLILEVVFMGGLWLEVLFVVIVILMLLVCGLNFVSLGEWLFELFVEDNRCFCLFNNIFKCFCCFLSLFCCCCKCFRVFCFCLKYW